MVEVLIEEMFGSDCNRPLDYERAVVGNAEQQEHKKGSERKNSFQCREKFAQKVFDRADMVSEPSLGPIDGSNLVSPCLD
jgi:hypothetical protein